MCAYPFDRRIKQIEIDFTSVLSFWELHFLSPIFLPLKIQQWKMVNTQRKCGNDSVASVKISQKSEKKVQHKQKAWFKSFNTAISLLFKKSVFYRISFASSKHIFKMKEVFVICMSDSSVIHTIRLELQKLLDIFRMKEAGKRK